MTAGCLLKCFLRCYLHPAGTNPHGLQNVGFSYAIEPALKEIYPEEEKFQEARKRYSSHYNCHPFFTPMILGLYIRLEADMAKGKLPEQLYLNIKDSSANTLSAIGDALFSGSILAGWVLVSACLIILGMSKFAFFLTILLFVFLQLFKLLIFVASWRTGLKTLTVLAKLKLMTLAESLKYFNAVILAVFIRLIPGLPATKVAVFLLPLFLAFLMARKGLGSRWLITVGLFIATLFLLEFTPELSKFLHK